MRVEGLQVGSYRIVRLLGEGGMGAVYEAEHVLIGRRAAVKLMHPELSRDLHLTHRFLNEARAANRVRHPGLVEVYEFGQLPEGAPYLIMELLEGETLRHRLERCGRRIPRALKIARSIALALSAAHDARIIHRDLKPHNVMLVADPERPGEERVKVLDFGIAKLTDSESARGAQLPALRTRSGVTMGTPEYMAPEQCVDASQVDAKSDVYALGIMIYELMAGVRPFESDLAAEVMTLQVRAAPRPLLERAPGLSPEVAALVHRMLAKHPSERPNMSQVAEMLRRWEDTPSVIPEGGETEELKSASRTEPSLRPAVAGEAEPRTSEGAVAEGPEIGIGKRYVLWGLVMAAGVAGALGILQSQRAAPTHHQGRAVEVDAHEQPVPDADADAGTHSREKQHAEPRSVAPAGMIAAPTGPAAIEPHGAEPALPDPLKAGRKRQRPPIPKPTLVVPLFQARPDAP